MRAQLDHLVVAARTLAEGAAWLAALTGAAPSAGGRHPAMGTHNALLRLGERLYLEIIACDPGAPAPGRPRWFDLDDPSLHARLAVRPRLVHWVARTDDLDACAAASPVPLGPIHPMARGDYRWRITIPDDGRRPAGGVVPALIQWDVAVHPADRLSPSPVALRRLGAAHPEPEAIRGALERLGLGAAVEVVRGPEPRLTAALDTPRGPVTLES